MAIENPSANETGSRRGILHSFRAKLILSFAAILGLMLLATLLIQLFGIPFSGYSGIYDQVKKENERTLSLAADMAKERLTSWFGERKGDAFTFAEGTKTKGDTERLCRFMNGSGKEKRDGLAALKKLPEYANLDQKIRLVLAAYPIYESIRIADAATKRIMVSTLPNEAGLSVPEEVLITEPVETGEPHIDMIQDRDKIFWIYIARPIRSGQSGKPIAVVILKINAEEALTPILRIVHALGEGAEVVFADKDLTVFAAISAKAPDAKQLVRTIIATAPPAIPVAIAARGQEGIITAIDYRGEASPFLVEIPGMTITPPSPLSCLQ